jgi:rod shape determining protein RodA
MSISSRDMEYTHIRTLDFKNLIRGDRVLMLIVGVLAVVGIITLISADRSAASAIPYSVKQVRNLGIASVFAMVLLCFDFRFLVSLGPFFYIASLILLLVVELQGINVNNAQSWIDLGVMHVQPSEFSKIGIIYMLAWYVSKIKERIRKLRWFVLAFLIPAVPGIMVLRQPDFGTAMTLGPVVIAMVYAAGCKRWHMAATLLCGFAGAALIILHANGTVNPPEGWPELRPGQKSRINSFLDPKSDGASVGWHQLQMKIAIGSGGMWGKGYRQGIQTNLSWVPEHHTDSIFAVYGEELGFMGSVALLGLFAAFLLRGLQLAHACPDLPGGLLGVGAVALLTAHIFINMAIAVGIMPVTGIPLPFLSYGGSFYITVMLCVGTLLAISVKQKKGMWTATEPVSRGTVHT